MQLDNILFNGSFDIKPDRPMKFRIGSIFDESKNIENGEYTFVTCKIDVGTPFVISKEKINQHLDKGMHY